MEQPKHEVVPANNNAGLLAFVLSLLKLPFSLGSVIYAYLFTKNLKNCLPGKVVVITGASSGLGEALAHTFYIAGCKVVLCARQQNELERVRKDLLQQHSTKITHPPVVLPLDLTDLNVIPNKIKTVLDTFGQIDILINNGGIGMRADAINTSIDVDIKVMLVNYFGTVAMTKAVLPSMIQRKEGRILCIGSAQGKFAIPQRSAYGASKHALQAFCDTLRAEMCENNIKVTLISPGYVNTSLSLNALTGSGGTYGIMDDSTATGYNRFELANEILQHLLADKKDVMIVQLAPRIAYYIRFLCPPLYFWLMEQRAKKLQKQQSKKDE